jgi:hypothetical protein
MAIDMAYAATPANAYIPYDCYENSVRSYGHKEGVIQSDKTYISARHPVDHKLAQITYCRELETQTIIGLTTTWAKWVGGERTDLKRTDVLGNLSAMYEFDRNTPLVDAGLAELNAAQLFAFETYWF